MHKPDYMTLCNQVCRKGNLDPGFLVFLLASALDAPFDILSGVERLLR